MKGKFTSTISSLAGKCVRIVMLVAVLMAANAGRAAELTIAEGSDTNNSVPVAGHYDYNMSFFIYPAEMLSSLNGSQVNSMTFYTAVGYENISWGDSEFNVYLQDTEKTGYTSDETPVNNNSGRVYSGTLCIVNGKMIVSFDTPYVYRGENIQVIMSGNLTSTTNCVFKGIEEQGSAISLYADGYNSGQKLQNFLPKVTFGYSIASPQSLIVSEITASGAKLEWTAGKENVLWNIRYKKDGDTECIEVNGLKNNEYEFTELTDGAKYIVEVQALLGEEESAWSLIEFTTKVKTAPGLTIAEGTATNNKVPLAGLAYFNKSCFIYPAEMLSALNCAQINSMTFYAAEGYENISWGDSEFNVYLQETEKTGYTSDENPFDENSGLVYSGNLNILNGKMIVSFDSPYVYNGGNMQVYVYSYINSETICCFYGIEKHEGAIFRFENGYNFGQELQNFLPKVTFDYVNIPNAVTASEIGETSAVISWTGYAECYNMQYRKVAGDDEQANDWIAVEDEISATSYMLDGLDANTKYEVQVQAVISETETTVWSSSCEFQTQIATGIESIDADDEDDSAIYDLMGRRVNNPASGIYIKGGKKVVVIR